MKEKGSKFDKLIWVIFIFAIVVSGISYTPELARAAAVPGHQDSCGVPSIGGFIS